MVANENLNKINGQEGIEASLKIEKETSSKNVAEIFSKSQALTEKHGMLTQISRQHEETLKN